MKHKSSEDYPQGQEINRRRILPGSKEEEEEKWKDKKTTSTRYISNEERYHI